MTSTDDLLRELVALNREQNVYIQTISEKIGKLATSADCAYVAQTIEREGRSRRSEHKSILEKVGNGIKDKLLLLSFIALSTIAGAGSAVSLYLKYLGG